MKNIQITLQPLSLIVGALLVGLVTLTISAISPAGGPTDRDAQLMVIDGQSSARNRVLIRAGNAYTVPSGKILIVDGLGGFHTAGNQYSAVLSVDGIQTARERFNGDSHYMSPFSVPGIRVNAGSVVSVDCAFDEAVATGYLADE